MTSLSLIAGRTVAVCSGRLPICFRISLTTDVNSVEPDQTAPIEVIRPGAHRLLTHALDNLAYHKSKDLFYYHNKSRTGVLLNDGKANTYKYTFKYCFSTMCLL